MKQQGTKPGSLFNKWGKVGIGAKWPKGKLDVNGTIYQRGAQLHADYVFEDDYKLESIKEHAEFMWKNKHLKAVPKATVDEDGVEIVEVGSHRKGIVEELEKAHIYIEQLHQKVEKQHKRNKLLEGNINEIRAENDQLKERLDSLEEMFLALSTYLTSEKLVKLEKINIDKVQKTIQ